MKQFYETYQENEKLAALLRELPCLTGSKLSAVLRVLQNPTLAKPFPPSLGGIKFDKNKPDTTTPQKNNP